MYYDALIAGFGGQGVLFIGNLLAYAAMEEGYHVTFMPSYGVEMRGGNANCSVIISSEEIGSPVIDTPRSAIFMNGVSLERFQESLSPGGLLVFNSSLIAPEAVRRRDMEILAVPANELASEVGNAQVASLVALGAYVEWTKLLEPGRLEEALKKSIPKKMHERYLDINRAALEKGYQYASNARQRQPGDAGAGRAVRVRHAGP
jgi:2-oxoglutarate ferredoxin oxidoreductase subunit gamma